ncbi:MAG: rod shape-determining protein, partial [Patescibacteria group bacterium]
IVEEPMAGAIGIRLPIHEPVGSMIIDIGGGTTDIAIISLGGIIRSKNLRVAGDKLNNDIISYIRNEFKILIGEKTSEYIKIAVGAVVPGESLETTIRGRDLITGLPREVVITDSDIREAMASSIDSLTEAAKEVLETTPPEILSDVMHRGVHLVGGGALIKGLDGLLSSILKLPVYIAEDPLTAIARGTGIILEDLEKYKDVLIQNEDELRSQK